MGTLEAAHRRAKIMAFKAVVVATLVALACRIHEHDGPNDGSNGTIWRDDEQWRTSATAERLPGWQLPHPTGVDIPAYIQEQKEQQRYESEKMAEKIKAQFEGIMKSVADKKHKYVMYTMTEFVSICACAQSSYNIYNAMFVANAQALNLTNVDTLDDWSDLKPYEAKSTKEAKEVIFAGTLYYMCTYMAGYMEFVTKVEANIRDLRNQANNNNVTPSG